MTAKNPKRIRPWRPPGKTDPVAQQSVRLTIHRELWTEFQENCLRQHQKPLATMRDWIAQFNVHCEENLRENTSD